MTTNILDEIMTVYPKHLIGAAWLYHAKHGTLPTVALLVRTYGTVNRVGRSETSKHNISRQYATSNRIGLETPIEHNDNITLSDVFPVATVDRGEWVIDEATGVEYWAEFGDESLDAACERLQALRLALGSRVAELLASGHSVRETAKQAGVSRDSINRVFQRLRKDFSHHLTHNVVE